MDITQIAASTHALNALYCVSIGDHSQSLSWNDAPDWQKLSAIAGIEAIRDGRVTKPSDSHESWMQQKLAEGWVWGPTKNPELKQHHCLVPYAELPPAQRMKDTLFFHHARFLLETFGYVTTQCCGQCASAPSAADLDAAAGQYENESVEAIARRAYHAYGEVTEFKNFRGEPMPQFDELPVTIQQAWRAAVCAAKGVPSFTAVTATRTVDVELAHAEQLLGVEPEHEAAMQDMDVDAAPASEGMELAATPGVTEQVAEIKVEGDQVTVSIHDEAQSETGTTDESHA